MEEKVVIVGAGQGGFQAAVALRQEKFDGPITLIGDEEHLPYERPPLSKEYLKDGNEGALALRPDHFYPKKDITLRIGLQVDSIDREAREVICGSERIPFDHLILATGTRIASPPISGLEHTIGLRTLSHARALRGALKRCKNLAIIGGGFIGLELAAVARTAGIPTTLVEAAPRLMTRAVSPEMSEYFRKLHDDLGIDLRLGEGVKAVTEHGLLLGDGSSISADLVVLAAGVHPNSELAEKAGLEVENGVKVDALLRTLDHAIFALGDCASFPDSRTGKLARLESVQAATDHARAIAKTIVHGSETPYSALPWFWSNQANAKLQIAGLAGPEDDSIAVSEGIVLRFCKDKLSAVETVNESKVHVAARRLLGRPQGVGRDELSAVAFDILTL